MPYEVEQKFPLTDAETTRRQLDALAVRWDEAIEQVDLYFAHPARDFARTDEALRIRRVGQQNVVTYKGPKIDAETKTREELEFPLQPGQLGADQFAELLEKLGFRRVAEVAKRRTEGTVDFEGRTFTVAWDEVQHVGRYVELELQAEESELDEARTVLQRLARALELRNAERRSYLELLLSER